jgi:hypothetical protein
METYIVFNLELQITKKVIGLELTNIFGANFTIELERDPWSITFYR